MLNNIENPDKAALATSAYTALISFVGIWFAFNSAHAQYAVLISLGVALGIGAVNFLVARYMIKQFVYNKVKLIFKTIHETRAGSVREERLIARKSLNRVEKEVKAWAEQRKSEIAELNSREKFRREFIGNVSHELKTPIFNIQGYILSLLDGGLEDEKINVKYLERANKSVDRMISLIEDMDTLNKLESSVLEIKKRPFLIVEFIKDTIDGLEDLADHSSIKIKFSPSKKLENIRVDADPGRIEQVLVNLITNAIKYSDINKTITIELHDYEKRILVEVADEGVGIPEPDLARIFERFYRVDKSRTRDAGGSGLGLSIVKHIIDAHGEAINVRSRINVGSTFSFTLKKCKKLT